MGGHGGAVGDFLFVPYSAHGHVNPMLPVVAELVARGGRVRVLVGAEFAAVVAGVSAEPVALPKEFEVQVPDSYSPLSAVRGAVRGVRKVLAGRAAARVVATQIAVSRPKLVVVDPMAPWAAAVARERCVPQVWFSTTRVVGNPRRTRGRPLVVNALPEFQPGPASDGQRVVVPLVRRRDSVPDVTLPWGEMRRRPVLLVSPGTVFSRGPRFFTSVVRAFGDTEWLVVMATGRLDPAVLGALPPNVIARHRVPQLAVLARSAVFLTHAGMNSVLESLAAGVPMVLAPRSREQRDNARRLARLGLGVHIGRRGVTPGDLRALVEALAHDQVTRRRVEDIRDRISWSNAAAEVADMLFQHADCGTATADLSA
ncbi:nucleotide disphospho-sugar-binding domain-containing protein [Saccharothrix sp. ALI-22-I]|uniref:nucleotide disphospho-sugar-binding domain-containing protein n=1 Tax=Saccharothrix sp. ALI-22-I TaxID=1933778 RepID=UPI00097BEDE1|nr:nucleotide disphospho-sugar-binding domain-containing protein [Saccharothrix sp. ALI-22-I]